MAVFVVLAVAVAAPVIMAALVRGSDIVNLIDAARRSGMLHDVDHGHGVVAVHERGHDHGRGRAHAHGHDNLHVLGF